MTVDRLLQVAANEGAINPSSYLRGDVESCWETLNGWISAQEATP